MLGKNLQESIIFCNFAGFFEMSRLLSRKGTIISRPREVEGRDTEERESRNTGIPKESILND